MLGQTGQHQCPFQQLLEHKIQQAKKAVSEIGCWNLFLLSLSCATAQFVTAGLLPKVFPLFLLHNNLYRIIKIKKNWKSILNIFISSSFLYIIHIMCYFQCTLSELQYRFVVSFLLKFFYASPFMPNTTTVEGWHHILPESSFLCWCNIAGIMCICLSEHWGSSV